MATEMTVIPLPDAARRLCVSPDVLTRLIQDDKLRIKNVKTGDGQIMLDEGDIERMAKAKALRDKIWERVKKYDGETIGVREARNIFHVPDQTIYRCIEKGYIRADKPGNGGRGRRRQLNKADVAYVAELVRHSGNGRGHRLFGPDTIPPHAMGA
jgi:hypothetical protein